MEDAISQLQTVISELQNLPVASTPDPTWEAIQTALLAAGWTAPVPTEPELPASTES